MQYRHYPDRPQSLDTEFVSKEFDRLVANIASAESAATPDAWLSLYEQWNALKSYVSSEGSRISYEQSADMNDPDRDERDRYFREEITPIAENGNSIIMTALLKSKHKQAIADRYGEYLIKQLETNIEPIAPVNSDLRVKVSDLANKYDKILSQGEVVVGGKRVTLPVARGMQTSSDPAIRKEAFMQYRMWFLEHHDELAEIFDGMVKLRHQMALNLGHENYIRLGYLGMGRTDYGPDEARQFRKNILEYIVPVQSKLFAQQAKALGTPTLKPWDAGYHPELTLPNGIAPIATQLEKAQKVFDRLSPRLGEHFNRMRAEKLIDLENRLGKRAGAFCTSFSDEGRAAIMCNSTGDEDDVSTLMHEMGHAFQAWESQKIEAIELQWPTSDAAEVHSMGMEFLSMSEIGEFFENQEHLAKYRRNRWRDSVDVICYIAIVDEFQHWVYEHPGATIAERDNAWSLFWDIYKPGIDYTGVEAYKYARWYAQAHIFQTPFYYIDYAIAETGAMQLALLDAKDHTKALETYIRLCEIGGTKSVLNIFKSAGLRSPFDPALMRDLMVHASNVLGLESAKNGVAA